MSIGIAEHKPNGRKEVTLPGSIATNNHIMLGRKRLDHRLVLVAIQPPCLSVTTSPNLALPLSVHDSPFKALDDNLFDIHLDRATRDASTLYHPEHPVVSAVRLLNKPTLCRGSSSLVYRQQHTLRRDQRLELMPFPHGEGKKHALRVAKAVSPRGFCRAVSVQKVRTEKKIKAKRKEG